MDRDPGLEQAIKTAGGVGALARLLGVAQPSVSNWRRVPAERVLAIESLTGVPRTVLRPDLYPAEEDVAPPLAAEPDEIDALRSQQYRLLSVLLHRAPDAQTLAILRGLAGDDSPLGRAHSALAEAAGAVRPEALQREFFDLFIGVGRGELLPYGSYYIAGFLNERPLARLREDLALLGIERAETQYEPEDHMAILCEIMAGIADGSLEAPRGADQRIFERHLRPWAGRFFADLETAAAARFYRPVGTIGRLFMELETEAFAMLRDGSADAVAAAG